MQIHELNNFTGTLGSGAYLAIDDGTDTGKISSQGLLAATEARIDNIIAGPAPSAEEIVDARLGADGVTYPSLGDAIRDQFTDVKSDINDNASDISVLQTSVANLGTHKVAQPLDEYNQPTDGTDGQLLRTKGDGSTEWVDVGLPTDEQTAQAISDWLDAHPEATTTVQNRSLTAIKLSTKLESEISPLSAFDGDTDEERIYDALITKSFRGVILGGNITINESIVIPNAQIREVKIVNSIITLNDDMFIAEVDNFARLPSFINCKFIGNGNAIFGSNYGVFGDFIGCSFDDCALITNVNGTVQSAYVAYCEILNDTVPFIKANNLYDCRIDGVVCERQNATFIDTYDSTGGTGGARSLWIENSLFEGFQATVLKLAGGGPSVYIKDCYFEGNVDGVLKLKKSTEGYDYLFLEIAGCKVYSPVTPFEVSDFTDNYRVKITIHDNYYYTTNTGTPMVTGIPIDNPFVFYNNRPTYTTDVISDVARYIYEPQKLIYPTVDSNYISIRSGGWIQFGRIVFIDMRIRGESTQAGTINAAISNLPVPEVANTRLPIVSGSDGSAMSKYIYINNTGSASLSGGITDQELYRIIGFYFTKNKTVR